MCIFSLYSIAYNGPRDICAITVSGKSENGPEYLHVGRGVAECTDLCNNLTENLYEGDLNLLCIFNLYSVAYNGPRDDSSRNVSVL